MSSPYTDEFLAAWRRPLSVRQPVTLFEISFPDAPGGPATIYAANTGEVVIEGQLYEPGCRGDNIKDTIAPVGSGPSPSSTAIYVRDQVWAPLGGLTAFQSLPTWRWQGALVDIYFWERSLPDAAIHKALQFPGKVDTVRLGEKQLMLGLIQDRSWNRRLPPDEDVIDVVNTPNAPDVSLGQTKPIVVGDWNDYPMRPPHTTQYTDKSKQQDSGGARGVLPLMLVDPGVGAAKVKLVAAGHPCADLLDRSSGLSVYAAAGDILAPLDTAGLTETLTPDDSYIEIDDDQMIAYYAVRPVDVRGGQNTATNPRRAMDPFDETSFATIDQATGHGVLELELPSGGGSGRIEAVDLVMCFRGRAGNTHPIRVQPYNPTAAVAGTALTATSTGTTPVYLIQAYDSAWWTQNWDFGGITGSTSPNRQTIDLRVDFTGGAANAADVFWIILRGKFRPSRSMVTPGSTPPGAPLPKGVLWSGSQWRAYIQQLKDWRDQPLTQPTLRVDASFFFNGRGMPDDVGGTLTGISNGLIQLAPDFARMILANYCGQTQFETAYDSADPTVGFGSLVKARHTLGRGFSGGGRLAAWIGGTQIPAETVLKKIAEQSLSCILLDRMTRKWQFHPWLRGEAATYDYQLGLEDIPDQFDPYLTSDVDLKQGVRVQFSFDHFRGRTSFETFVGPKSSSMGYSLPSWRDQKPITIDASNDKINIKYDTTVAAVTATLAHATYTEPHALAADVEAKINTALAGLNRRWRVWHGFNVTSSLNFIGIDYIDNVSGLYTGFAAMSIAVKDYGTPDALAAAWQKALNDAQVVATIDGAGHTAVLVFAVSYDHATNKYTVSSNYHFRIHITTSSGVAYSIHGGWQMMGWNAFYVASARNGSYGSPDPTNGLPGTPITAPTPMYAERYKIVAEQNGRIGTANITNAILWGTGANAANNCALELGWDKVDITMPTSGDMGFYGSYPRNMRETICDQSDADYGPKDPIELTADWVRDEQTAILLRNGLLDYTCVPLVMLAFVTHVCPDLQRLRTFGFRASVDQKGKPYPKPGGDGSWAGKSMRVIEVDQNIHDTYATRVLAMES